MLALLLNDQGLPYPDPVHPIIVHFVIAMVIFSFFCDLIGYFTHNSRLLEVGFWNLFVASVSGCLAVLFGQFEAGIANTYDAVQPTLTSHTVTGWLLAAFLVAVAGWRFALRRHDSLRVSPAYLGVATVLICLVCVQTWLGTQLVWVYGLHVEPVVEAAKQGVLQ